MPAASPAGPPPGPWTVPFAHDVWDAAPALASLLPEMLHCDGMIEVVGHSCSLGSPRDRRLVATARAETVAQALVAAGHPSARLDWRAAAPGEGPDFPDTRAGRARARRAEVRCVPDGAAAPAPQGTGVPH